MSEAPVSLFDYLRRRVGFRRAVQVLEFMVAWDIARRALHGREPLTLAEYADWWKRTRTTAFREQARFREALPGETTPDRLLDLAAQAWDQRTGVAGLGATRVGPAQLA